MGISSLIRVIERLRRTKGGRAILWVARGVGRITPGPLRRLMLHDVLGRYNERAVMLMYDDMQQRILELQRQLAVEQALNPIRADIEAIRHADGLANRLAMNMPEMWSIESTDLSVSCAVFLATLPEGDREELVASLG